jgi:hypothetical protein
MKEIKKEESRKKRRINKEGKKNQKEERGIERQIKS